MSQLAPSCACQTTRHCPASDRQATAGERSSAAVALTVMTSPAAAPSL
jgi:hypothetical protein